VGVPAEVVADQRAAAISVPAGSTAGPRPAAVPVGPVPVGPGAFAAGTAGIGDRCAAAARRRGDQIYGTAAPVTRWLLIEHPGPWGRDALRECGLPIEVVDTLARRAAAARVRILLVRRQGRGARPATRRVGWVDSRLGRERTWWTTWSQPDDLLAIDPGRPIGTPTAEPVYLVCAHGRHDACCAIWGRPVAAALAAVRPDAVWECSHIGGDRFAANVIALPHGLYYGAVTPQDASTLITAYEDGLLVPHLLRGRSTLPAVAQAAQHHAREALLDFGVDALPPLDVTAAAPGTSRVVLDHPTGPVAVTVRAERAPAARLTCAATKTERTRVFRLLAIERPVVPVTDGGADVHAG
jgi:hypothetical protein